MIALIAAGGVAVTLLPSLIRLFVGPTLHDRALAAKGVGMRAALICAALAVAQGRSDWLDAAFALMLGWLVAMTAVMKVFRARTFQAPLAREDA